MNKLLFIPFLILICLSGTSQENLSKKITPQLLDDNAEGYVLFSYKVPEEGHYTFSIEGGLAPKKECVIYYYEYRLQLNANGKSYPQESYNIASQAQDGNICYFNTNEKNNKVSGTFKKDELVEMRLVVLKSEVDGTPHNKLKLLNNTLVQVERTGDQLAETKN